jgi:hypothetical protein
MLDFPRRDFIIANQAGKNGKPGSIGGSPSGWPQGVGEKIKNSAGTSSPATIRLGKAVEHLIETTVVPIKHQDMTVPGRLRSSFDQRVGRDRIWAGITFVFVVEGDWDLRLSPVDHRVGYPNGAAVPQTGPEVRMQSAGRPDCVDEGS